MPASTFTTHFNFALSTDDDFNWGDDFRNNLDKADSALKEMADLAANFSSSISTHLISTDHHWRYYTQEQLDDGQLDTIYYTETELDNGALDSRYPNKNITRTKNDVYSKTEMDSLFYKKTDFAAGSSLLTTLDSRYYTQSAINSGALDGLFYSKTTADQLLDDRGREEKAKLTGGSFDDHVVKFQIQPTGQVELFDPAEPDAVRTVSSLKASSFYVFTYAVRQSGYPYKKNSVEVVDRYGYALEKIRPGFPAGYPCAFTYDKSQFTNTIGQSVSSVWIPASVNQLEDVDSNGNITGDALTHFGGTMISLEGTELKSTYGTTPNQPDPPPDQPDPGPGPFATNIFYYTFQRSEDTRSYYVTTNTSSPDLSATSQSAAFVNRPTYLQGGFHHFKGYYYGYTSTGTSGVPANSLVKMNYDGDVLRSVKLSYTFTQPDTSLSATIKVSDWDYYTRNGIKYYYVHDVLVDESNNVFYVLTNRAVRRFNLSTGALIRTIVSNDGACGQIGGGGCYYTGMSLKGSHIYFITLTKTSFGDLLNSTIVKDVNTGSTKTVYSIYRYNAFRSSPSQREMPWDLFFYNGQFYYVRADSTTLDPRIDVWDSEEISAIGGGTVTVPKNASLSTDTPIATYNPGSNATSDSVLGSTYFAPIY